MAIITNNAYLEGMSGKIGNIVYRQVNDKTVAGKPPVFTLPWAERQIAHREKMKAAAFYAKRAMADPEKYAFYQAVRTKGNNAYNMAIKDYFSPPEIISVNLEGYRFREGGEIIIDLNDNLSITGVVVQIMAPDGSIVEEGNAQPDQYGYQWNYTTRSDNYFVIGSAVIVSAYDLPGNRAVTEIPL